MLYDRLFRGALSKWNEHALILVVLPLLLSLVPLMFTTSTWTTGVVTLAVALDTWLLLVLIVRQREWTGDKALEFIAADDERRIFWHRHIEAVRRARATIRAVSFHVGGPDPGHEAHGLYYQEIENAIKTRPGFTYQRVVQLPTNAALDDSTVGPQFVRHVETCLAIPDLDGYADRVVTVSIVTPDRAEVVGHSLVLIDDQELWLGLPQFTRTGVYVTGTLRVRGADHPIVQHFVEFFKRLDARGQRVTRIP